MGGLSMKDVLPPGATVAWSIDAFEYGRTIGLCAAVTIPGKAKRVLHAVRVDAVEPDALIEAHTAMVEWFAGEFAKAAA